MSTGFRRVVPVLLLAASMASGVRAESPRITLSLRGVTAEEAVAKLGLAARSPVQIYAYSSQDPSLAQRSDFDWKDVTLSQALRQLCARYQLRPGRGPAGVVLYFSPGVPVAAPPKRVSLVEKGGMQLFLKGVSVYENRQLNFTDGPAGVASGSSSLQIQIGAELGNVDPDTVAGIQNVTARDDLGNTLAMNGPAYHPGAPDGFPDQWTSAIGLPAPSPRARKITWLEGDVMVYRQVRPVRVEIPLPLAERVVRRQQGEIAFSVSEFQVRPQDPEDDPEPLLRQNAQVAGSVLTLRTRVYMPSGGQVQSRSGYGVTPYLVGKSGKIYTPSQFVSARSGSDGRRAVVENTLSFPGVTEPPAALVWDLLERSEPEKLFSFRMMDIPLPAPAPPGDRPAGQPAEPPVEHPFYQKGGGTLVLPVRLPDNGVRSGKLDLGLALRGAAGWGPVRWIQVDVTDGEARLGDVKPGAYKVVRRFVPRDGELPTGVRWINGEAQASVAAGKELRLPPLEWTLPKPGVVLPASPRGKG